MAANSHALCASLASVDRTSTRWIRALPVHTTCSFARLRMKNVGDLLFHDQMVFRCFVFY